MTTPFESRSWPSEPTMPSSAPAGYVTPNTPQPPQNPPIDSPDAAAIREQFWELLIAKIVEAIVGVFIPGNGSAFDQLSEFFQGFFAAFDGIDMSDPGAVLGAIANAVAEAVEDLPVVGQVAQLIANLVNGGQPINAANLFGSLLPGLFSNVPISALNNEQPNQWASSGFPTADTIASGAPEWLTWDGSVGRTAAGSAKVTAGGTYRAIKTAPIPVVPGKEIDIEVYARWVGLVYTGTPIRLGVRTFEPGTAPGTWKLLGSIDLDSIASPGENSADHEDADEDGWVRLSSQWTVPAGASAYQPRLIVTGDATAGDVWFDDDSGKQTGLILQEWVQDLVADLAALLEWVESVVDSLLDALGLDALGSLADRIFDLADEIGSWFGDTQGALADIVDLGDSLSDFANRVLTGLGGDGEGLDFGGLIDAVRDALQQIPVGNIDGLTSLLDGLLSLDTWQDFLDAIKGGPGGAISDLLDRIQNLNSDGEFNAAALVGTVASEAVEGFIDLADEVTDGFKNIFNTWFDRDDAEGTAEEIAITFGAIKDAVISGYTVSTFTSSETNWPIPENITEFVAVLTGGGQNGSPGSAPSTGVGAGGAGGFGGSWLVQTLDVGSLPAEIDIQVGSTGNKSYIREATGSHDGTVIVESPAAGAEGGIAIDFGYAPTLSAPGAGGKGGDTSANQTDIGQPGENGGNNAIAAGGVGGAAAGQAGAGSTTGQNGSAGSTVDPGSITKCGGGGGGGGGAGRTQGLTGGRGGNGGPGGFPGGGGGGGGGGDSTFGGGAGSGGSGAAGCVWLFYR